MSIFRRLAALVAVTLLAATLLPFIPGPAFSQADSRYFPETQHTISGKFLQYWNDHGGLAQQGYPLTEQFQEKNKLNGQTYTVQYFERAVFELHPENQPPYDVLLSQLGKFELESRYPNGSNPAAAPVQPGGAPPAPAATPTQASAPPALSGKVDLLQTFNYKSQYTASVIFGGVAQNNTGKTLSKVEIIVSLLDSAGNTVASGDSINYGGVKVLPGELMPFWVVVSDAPASWANVSWQVVPTELKPGSYADKTFYHDLVIEGASLQPPANSYSDWKLVGRVKNTGSKSATLVSIVAAVYDGSGTVVDASSSFAKLDKIGPGETSPFEISFSRDGINPVKFVTYVSGFAN